MQNYVITISRESGAGGIDVARLLSEQLNIPYYDRDLLKAASEVSGINIELFGKVDERIGFKQMIKAAGKVYRGEVLPPESDDYTATNNLFAFQAKVIKELSESTSCVIVGRAANYLLKDKKHVIKVFLHAPLEWRKDNVKMNNVGHSISDILRDINAEDKRRGDYYNYYTGRNWRAAEEYDISIDMSKFGIDGAVELIKGIIPAYVGE